MFTNNRKLRFRSYSVIISRQYHSNSAFEMFFVCYEENLQGKNGLCLYGFNAIIWFWMFMLDVRYGSTFLMIKQR